MSGNVVLSAVGLDTFKGKHISAICVCGFDKNEENHCAHFVSHALELNDSLKIGLTCAQMTNKGTKLKAKGAGACIRVNEVFNFCKDIPIPDESGCLIYITKLANFKKDGTMGDMSKKHIGIYLAKEVWHYSNTDKQVRRWTKDEWVAKLDAHYDHHTVVKFTVIPDGANFLNFAGVLALAQ